jgi:hypothetical protein
MHQSEEEFGKARSNLFIEFFKSQRNSWCDQILIFGGHLSVLEGPPANGPFSTAPYKARAQVIANLMEDIDRIRPMIQTFLATTEHPINSAKAISYLAGFRCHGRRAMGHVRPSRHLQVPHRIASQQTLSASTLYDVPLL